MGDRMRPDDILEVCLDDIASGRKSVIECIADFPEAPGLADQLLAAQALWAWAPPMGVWDPDPSPWAWPLPVRAATVPALSPEASRTIEGKLRQAVRPARPQPIVANDEVRPKIQSILVVYALMSLLVERLMQILFSRPRF